MASGQIELFIYWCKSALNFFNHTWKSLFQFNVLLLLFNVCNKTKITHSFQNKSHNTGNLNKHHLKSYFFIRLIPLVQATNSLKAFFNSILIDFLISLITSRQLIEANLNILYNSPLCNANKTNKDSSFLSLKL